MKVIDEPMAGVKLIETTPHGDARGSFTETFNRQKMAAIGIDHEFVQDNESRSVAAGTVRGIHLQLPPNEQGKLVRVLRGSILDIAVDVRPSSPTFGQYCGVTLTADDATLFWIPPGFGHAFCTLEPDTTLSYKVTALYAPQSDRSIRWDDPTLAIDWPVAADAAVLSAKDAEAPSLEEFMRSITAEPGTGAGAEA